MVLVPTASWEETLRELHRVRRANSELLAACKAALLVFERPKDYADIREDLAAEACRAAIAAAAVSNSGIDPVLIWSMEHNAWWAAHECGYTTERGAAGRYTRERAQQIVDGSGGKNERIEELEVPRG